jgi:hypothetical protein
LSAKPLGRWTRRSQKDGSCDLRGERRKEGGQPSTACAGDEMSTRLPAYTLVELVLRFGIDRVELDRLVEHFPRRPPAARRDRPRFAWPADVGEDALDCATRMSAFRGTAAVEILETDVGSGSGTDSKACQSERPETEQSGRWSREIQLVSVAGLQALLRRASIPQGTSDKAIGSRRRAQSPSASLHKSPSNTVITLRDFKDDAGC